MHDCQPAVRVYNITYERTDCSKPVVVLEAIQLSGVEISRHQWPNLIVFVALTSSISFISAFLKIFLRWPLVWCCPFLAIWTSRKLSRISFVFDPYADLNAS